MRFAVLLLLFLKSIATFSQIPSDFKFQSISIAQGLSQSSAYSVMQDHLGYIWAGTQGGMNRYDGYSVKKYEPITTDTTTISIGWRTAAHEDHRGNIWTGTNMGAISMYDRKKDQWKNYDPGYAEAYRKQFPNVQLATLGIVLNFYIDTTRQLLYATTFSTGLIVMDLKTGKFNRYWFTDALDRNQKWQDNSFVSVLPIDDHTLLITTGNGIAFFDQRSQKFTKRFFKSADPDKQVFYFQAVKIHPNEYIIGCTKGLVQLNIKTGESTTYTHNNDPKSISAGQVRSICLSKDKKKLWLGIDGLGVELMDLTTGTFLHINEKTAPNAGIKSELYYNIIEDKEDNIWLGTSSSGMLKYDPNLKKMNYLRAKDPADMPLGFSVTWGSLIDSDNNLWVGGAEAGAGITMINRKNRTSTRYLNDSKSLETRRWVFGEDNIGAIYAIGYSRLSRILYRKDKDAGSFKEVSNLTKAYKAGKLASQLNQTFFYLTSSGDLIAGGDTAILIADKTGALKMKAYTPLLKVNSRIKYIINKGPGKTYILTNKHFWKWNEQTGALTNLTPWIELNPVQFLIMAYADVLADQYVYIPTFGYGLMELDLKAKKYKILNLKDGIPNQYLYDVTIDKNGMVWSSSNFGIIRYNPKTKAFKGFYKTDGAQDFEFNASSLSKSKNGELAYCGLFGANYFFPENVKDNPNAPDVIIQSITKKGNIINIEAAESAEEVEVQYNENQLSLEFIAFNFKSPEFNQYAYKMEGYDNDWNYSGNRHFATYTNLPSGKYKFLVKASNNDGIWNEKGATLLIRVYPAPWFSWWAYLIYLITLGYLIKLFVKYRETQQKKKMDDERKNSELQAARDFQQSMLPKTLPARNDLDIATFLRSSTEIGGDYYDFFEQKNGELYVVCGDATGHGIISGMMVSIAKAGLNGISSALPNEILNKLNSVIKRVDLGTMRMSLNMLQINNNQVTMSSAAMPPIYRYVAASGQVEEIQISGLPLGGLKNELFELEERPFERGDAFVLLSDGLPEAPNKMSELFDYTRVHQLIEQHGSKDAATIKDELINAVDTWLSGENNPDDITIIVIKKK